MAIILKPAAFTALANDPGLQLLLSKALEPERCNHDFELLRLALLNRGLATQIAIREDDMEASDERE